MVKEKCIKTISSSDEGNQSTESSQARESQNTPTDIHGFILMRKKEISSSSVNQLEIQALSYFADKNTKLEMLDKYPAIKKAFIKYNCQVSSSFPTKKVLNVVRLNLLSKCETFDYNVIEKFIVINANKES